MVKITINGQEQEFTGFGSFMIFLFVWLLISLAFTIISLVLLSPFFAAYIFLDFIL